ncbi:hypothetical protein D3C75_976550 [compost metagenome]
MLAQALIQHGGIFRSDDRCCRCQRHQVHGAFAGGQGQHHELGQQPQGKEQQVAVVRQVFAKVPQPQVDQDVPWQERFRQFGQVVMERLIVPGLDERAIEATEAVGQQHFGQGL